MIKPTQIDLAKYRFSDALEKLESARILLEKKQFKDSLSRPYQAMFSAVRDLLSLKELDSSKHSGVISLFNQHFIKTGIIEKNYGRFLKKAQLSRERSDQGDYIITSLEEVQNQINNADKLIQEIKRLLIIDLGEF